MPSKVIESSGDTDVNRSDQLLLTRLDNAQLALEQKQVEFAQYLDELKAQETLVKDLKEKLYERMEESGQKKIETNHFTVTAIWGTTKHTYDMKALKAINPTLFEQVDNLVGKETPIKGYVKIFTKEKK